jgi:adenine C2-methylase RlmN of 23S rRNA A2503 and tRNA A37
MCFTDDVNDAPEHARKVVRLISGMSAKVNSRLESGSGFNFGMPKQERVLAFQEFCGCWCPNFHPETSWPSIFAACGQLRTMELVQVS